MHRRFNITALPASISLLTVALLLINGVYAQELLLTVDHPDLDEQSGIIASPTYADLFWVLEDSGSEPVLFPLNGRGEARFPAYLARSLPEGVYPGLRVLGAENIDWESIAHLKDTLVIADMGNNYNYRRDLGLYFLLEPNPEAANAARPFLRLSVAYPDQTAWPPDDWRFDCEAVFGFQGKLYFLTKHRANRNPIIPAPHTRLYRLDTRDPGKVNTLTFVQGLSDLGGWVTAADMSPNASRLAVLIQNPLVSTVWIFKAPKSGDHFFDAVPLIVPLTKVDQAEGVCFVDESTLIVTNEQRNWYSITLEP